MSIRENHPEMREALRDLCSRFPDEYFLKIDHERGYHVAMFRDRGMGYAYASDLDEPSLLQLISASLDGGGRPVLLHR